MLIRCLMNLMLCNISRAIRQENCVYLFTFSQKTQILTFDFFSFRAIIQPPQFQYWELLHIFREGIPCGYFPLFLLRNR